MQVKDIESEFLPLIYDILKCVERDPSDATAKNKVNYLWLSLRGCGFGRLKSDPDTDQDIRCPVPQFHSPVFEGN